MSGLQYPERLSSKDVQIWDNAAFDNGESECSSAPLKFSWPNLKDISSVNLSSESFESDCGKENVIPLVMESPVSMKCLGDVNMKPLQVNNVVANVGPERVQEMGVLEWKKENVGEGCGGKEEERNLDEEMEEIVREISRLSTRLESLKIEKAKRNAKVVEKRVRIVAAKFMDPPKQGTRSSVEERKLEDSMCTSAKLKATRRGLSMGPGEIMRGMRRDGGKGVRGSDEERKVEDSMLGNAKMRTPMRGLSMGPGEIMKGLSRGGKQGVRGSDDEKKMEDSMSVSAKNKTPRRGLSMGPAEIMKGLNRGVKQGVRGSDEESKMEDSMCVSAKLKTPKRDLSMGSAEMMRGIRRGLSLGPSEIYPATKLRQLSKQEITPVQPSSNRRKSCYWKLQDIDELRVTKKRGESASLSPKSWCRTVTKAQIPKAATTIGNKKLAKKEDVLMLSIQPKKLFTKDGEKSVSAKKPVKSGRVVASRYNQLNSGGGGNSAMKELRKRSWPETEEDTRRSEKKRVSLVGKSQGAEQPTPESRVKKRWEIPSEVSIQTNVDPKTPTSVSKLLEVVPKIKTFRCVNETSRDSGPAKKVAELVGRKFFFSLDDGNDEEVDDNVCQTLSFEKDQLYREHPKIKVLRCSNESSRDSGSVKRVSESEGRKSFFADDDDEELPVFSFEEEI